MKGTMMGNNKMQSKTTNELADAALLDGLSSGRLEYMHAPNFGIWHLTVSKASELVAVDMWCCGILQIEGSEDRDHQSVLESLSDYIAAFETRLLDAIDAERLVASAKRRDFNDRLIPDDTYIEFGELSKWLDERHYERGDAITGWTEQEAELDERVRDEVAYLRAASESGLLKQWMPGEPVVLDEVAAFKEIVKENHHLKAQLARVQANQLAKVDRPMLTRERRTLLTIIAAFCKHEGIDPNQRGAPTEIAKMTDDLGVPVTADTITKVLAEIPDALEARMK